MAPENYAAVSAPEKVTPKKRERETFVTTFRRDIIAGLSAHPKTLPCKYLYDKTGSELFDQICDLPEYYPTRTELGILRSCLPEVATLIGPNAQVVEYGSGSGLKTRLLLKALDNPTSCAMIEISRSYLMRSADDLAMDWPNMHIIPICADYTRELRLPPMDKNTKHRLAFFPGSTIGNFNPAEAKSFLRSVANTVGSNGGLLIGVDLRKDLTVLEAAYDDAAGVTAAFNKNLLRRINHELDGTFCLANFKHEARYNESAGRIEMHLKAKRSLKVSVADKNFSFAAGETIHTESSYKHTLSGFEELEVGS